MPDNTHMSHSKNHFIELFRIIKPFHKDIAKGMVIGPVIGLLSVAPPYFSKLLFDRVADSYDVTLMLVLVAGIIAFSITSAISEAIASYYSNYLNIKLENTTQLLFFNHVQHLPLPFFYRRQVGEIASRFQEIKSALGSISAFLNVIFGQGIYLLIVPPFLFLLNWKLALVAIIAIPFSAIAVYWLASRLRTTWKHVVESHAQIDAHQVEMLNQIATVKVMQLERPFYDKASSQLTNILGAHMKAQSLTISFQIFDKCINILNIGLFTWLGWYFIIKGDMSIGDYVAFAAYIGYLRNPMKEVISLFTKFQQWAVHLDRVFEFLNCPPEQDPKLIQSPVAYDNAPLLKDRIHIRELDFHYNKEKQALHNISMTVNAGDIISLIGTSGSGKSTLLRLLTRIEQGHSGEIYVDDRPIDTIPIAHLRSQLGVVWQDVDLFKGTLYQNLTIGAPDVSKQHLDDIVQLCCLTQMIDSLPDGYNTKIAERGITLSGGQRQRVALARALLRSTPILILDEAMSHLDVETEAKVAANLIAHAKKNGQTVIFVTHRVSMATLADNIYLFKDGHIIGSGKHHELLSSSPHYQNLQRLSKDISSHE